MDLILWRHAEAAEKRELADDLMRPLTSKGERQAARMADWLNQRLAASTRILVSPARRCQQTAKALGRKFRTLDEIAPDGNGESLLKAARWPGANEPVLVVGHQPMLGFVASFVLADVPRAWTIRKAGVWWIRGRGPEGATQAILQAVQSPDML